MPTSKKKVLITGCGGMLGAAVYKTFKDDYEVKATDIDLNEEWLEYLDVRDWGKVWETVEKFKPEIILHLAALTDLEYCESYPQEAWLTNALGTENLALAAKKSQAAMVYISTAGIFNGEKEEYYDYDQPDPINAYGKSKYYGELITTKMVDRHLVFRAGWMMGGGVKKDKKFINKIYQKIKKGEKTLYVVDDKLGSPTYTHNFAAGIKLVLEKELWGVYNQVGMGSGSRYDVAIELVRLLGLDKEIEVKKVGSDYFKEQFFVKRPTSERLINAKLSNRGVNQMRNWRECLQEYAKEYASDFLQSKATKENERKERVSISSI